MKTKNIVFSLLFVLINFSATLKAQCFRGVEYRVIDSQAAIEITFDADYEYVQINLEDNNLLGNIIFEKSIEFHDISKGNSLIVFDKLKPSNYTIQLVTGGCKWQIGGMEGVIIKNEDEK